MTKLYLLLTLALPVMAQITPNQVCYSNVNLTGTSFTIPSASFLQSFPTNGAACGTIGTGDTIILVYGSNLSSVPTVTFTGQTLVLEGGSNTPTVVQEYCGTGAAAATPLGITTTSISNGYMVLFDYPNTLSCTLGDAIGTNNASVTSALTGPYPGFVPMYGVQTRTSNEVVIATMRGAFANQTGIASTGGFTTVPYFSAATWASGVAYASAGPPSRLQPAWGTYAAGGTFSGYIAAYRAAAATPPAGAAYSQAVAYVNNAAGGSDLNGCAFMQGASGYNYPQNQAAPVVTFDGVTNKGYQQGGAVLALSLPGGAYPNTGDVGNYILYAASPQSTAQAYQITSIQIGYTSNLTQWGFDWVSAQNPGNGTVSTGTNIGGTCATVNGVIATVRSTRNYIAYNPSASYPPFAFSVSLNGPAKFIGYYQTPDDNPAPGSGHQPIIQPTSAAVAIDNYGGQYSEFDNLHLKGNGIGTVGVGTNGSLGNAFFYVVANSEIEGFTNEALQQNYVAGGSNGPLRVDHSWIHGNCLTGGGYAIHTQDYGAIITNSWIDHNTCSTGAVAPSSQATVTPIVNNVISNNTGYGIGGINALAPYTILHNTIYNNTGDCMNDNLPAGSVFGPSIFAYNICADNGGYGMNWLGPQQNPYPPYLVRFHPTAYYNNALGQCNSRFICSTAAPISDIFLTCEPLNNPAGNDFSLSQCGRQYLTRVPSPSPFIRSQEYYGAYQPAVAAIGTAVQ